MIGIDGVNALPQKKEHLPQGEARCRIPAGFTACRKELDDPDIAGQAKFRESAALRTDRVLYFCSSG